MSICLRVVLGNYYMDYNYSLLSITHYSLLAKRGQKYSINKIKFKKTAASLLNEFA